MPGMGGPPPMAGMGMPLMGQTPMGPDPAQMQALEALQGNPSPGGEDEALTDATTKLGFAASRIQLRSPEAAKLLNDAISKVQQARQKLQAAQTGPVGAPTDLMGGMGQGMPMGFPGA